MRLEEEHSLEKLFACVRRVSSGQWMRASLQGNAGLYVRAFVGWADMYIKKIRPKSWVFTCIQVHTPGAAPGHIESKISKLWLKGSLQMYFYVLNKRMFFL